jgi:hypothetical protein
LAARAENLVREIHFLAKIYHWSVSDILRLSLKWRLDFLILLDEEVNAQLVAEIER